MNTINIFLLLVGSFIFVFERSSFVLPFIPHAPATLNNILVLLYFQSIILV